MIPGLSPKHNELIVNILHDFPQVKEAILYGSRAKGNFTEGSDIDLTIKGKDIPHNTLLKIKAIFENSSLPNFVDISIYDMIQNEDLIEHIDRVGISIYGNKNLNSNS